VSSDAGDRSAADALFSALYTELHDLARRQLAGAGSGVTIGPTTLLHEAYLNIAKREGAVFPDRARFMGYAAKVMRGLVIDHVRSRAAQKRGGAFHITTLNEAAGATIAGDREILQIAEALESLTTAEPELAAVVDLKFFCGFSFPEIAALRGVSERTAQRQWEKARTYLHRWIREAGRTA
jgi:RNA polymerase sigma factor (TIGR02999 family)